MLLVWEIQDDDFENVHVWQKIKIQENSEVTSTCEQLLKNEAEKTVKHVAK